MRAQAKRPDPSKSRKAGTGKAGGDGGGFEVGRTLVVDAQSLSYGRAAVARASGRVVFVDGAAPGDRVRAKVRAVHAGHAEADTVEIIEAGPHRVDPFCRLAGRCGGCPWQHVAYPAQLEAKRAALVDCLERIAKVEAPMVETTVPSPLIEQHRNRVQMRFDGTRLGFYRARSHEVVEVSDCPIAEPGVRAALEAAAETARALRTEVTRVEIIDGGALGGAILALNARGRFHPADARALAERVSDSANPIRGILLWGRGWRRRWGRLERRVRVEPQGPELDFSGGSFGQVNSAANRLLVEHVKAVVGRPRSILELYAGAGNFTFALAGVAGYVHAVESDAAAVRAARATAARAGVDNLTFTRARVQAFLDGGVRETPDLLLVDPPRSGLASIVDGVASLGARRIVYVSCQPATLARDLRALLDAGYRLDRVVPFDLFPHTFHVEAVCSLELT